MPAEEFRTGDPLFTVDRSLTVLSWNEGAERLTGIAASEAVGQRCWQVLGGVGEQGDVICHAGCASARLALEGFPVPCRGMLVRAPAGRCRVRLSTVGLGDGRLLHVFVDGPPPQSSGAALTPRQHEVLELIADGLPAKAVSARLGVTETTVRTHIREILRELGAHSQLEAVANARRKGLLQV